MASPAIPELMRLAVEEENEEAALAILLVGSDAAPKLTGMLTHSDWRYRYAATGILVKLDYASVKAALPAVIERLEDEAWQVRKHAGYALEEYFNPQRWTQGRGERAHEPDQRVFLNALIPCLDDDHPEVRVMALSLIGRLGPVAKPVVPSVAELLADGDPRVRRYAREALVRIDPAREKGVSQ
jgi:HEAT repeat protein